ncbi:hypothetical protein ACNHYB_15270 [Isoptericola jiangsuensis]|uniref:hypothetical protein n=1 Tax=Isoptericola jiangsuensis TaxID=548579 RepID=UPI003AACADCB
MRAAPARRAVVAVAAITLTLTACSTEAPTGFCDQFASLESLNQELSAAGTDDPDDVTPRLEAVAAALDEVEAPADVADSFTVYATALRNYTDAAGDALADLEHVDQEAIAAATAAMTSEETAGARAELAGYTAQHCG